MEKLIILNFYTGDVDIYPTEYNNEPDMDALLEELGHHANDCLYMFSNGSIVFHKDTLK